MISLAGLVHAIVLLIVAGLIFRLLYWLVNYVGLPQPFDKVCRIILAIAAVIVVCGILLSLAGYNVIAP